MRSTTPLSLWIIRLALLMLAETPPLALGNCELARELLPDVHDSLARGLLVCQLLHTTILHLRPAGKSDPHKSSWWPYFIHAREYEDCQTRSAVCSELAISAVTYTRAKRRGLDRIAGELPYIAEKMSIELADRGANVRRG